MNSRLKLLVITLPLIALGAAFLVVTLKTKAPPVQAEAAERASAVRYVPARASTLAPRLSGYGLVAPAESFEAIAQVGGTVAWVNPDLKRGAVLPAGAVLLRIASEDYALAVAQAEANIRAAEARLAELDVQEANQSAALEIERAVLELKAADLARAEALNKGGTLPETGLDTVRAAHLAQRQKLQSIESTLALIPTQRAVQAEQVAVSQAALATARLNLGRTELSLPFAARVASVAVETGRFLRAGEVAAVLDGTRVAEVEAQVPVADLRRLLRLSAPGAAQFAADPGAMTAVLEGLELAAEVRLELGDESLAWPARVVRVSDKIEPGTGSLGVIVEVAGAYEGAGPGARPPLTKGMFVEVVVTGRPVAGMLVPRLALAGGQLWLADGADRLAQVAVTPLVVQGELALIGAGLAEGDRVVVSQMPLASPGQLLSPELDAALAAALEAAQ